MSIQYKNSDILSVPNVAALFTLKNLADNQLVQTQGYSTEGVGSNLYRYDSGSAATIDGGFVLPGPGGTLSFSGTTFNGDAGDGGRFIAVDRSVADASQFGAVGDGSTDESGVMNRWSASGAGRFTLKKNAIYVVSSYVKFDSIDGFSLDLNGATIKCHSSSPANANGQALRVIDCSNWTVKNGILDGNKSNRTSPSQVPAHNMAIYNCHRWRVENVKSIDALVDGFYVDGNPTTDGSTKPTSGVLLNCTADGNNRQGLSVISGRGIRVCGGEFINTGGLSPGAGIDFEADATTATPGVDSCSIEGVRFSGNQGRAVILSQVGSSEGCRISGCTITEESIVTATFTVTGSSDVFTSASHPFIVGDAVMVKSSGSVPTGLDKTATYYVVEVPDANSYKISLSYGGSPVSPTSTGSGTLTAGLVRGSINLSTGYSDISGNLFKGLIPGRAAIDVAASATGVVSITGNKFYNVGDAWDDTSCIYAHSSSGGRIIIDKNIAKTVSGLCYISASYTSIHGNIVEDASRYAGLSIVSGSAKGVSVVGNTAIDCTKAAIYSNTSGTDLLIANNAIVNPVMSDPTYGAFRIVSNKAIITGNTFVLDTPSVTSLAIAVYGNGCLLDGNKAEGFSSTAPFTVAATYASRITKNNHPLIVPSFTASDATPSVLGSPYAKTANASPTTITALDDGVAGHEITIFINDANTTIDFTGTNLKGNGGSDWTPTTGDHMTCVYDGTNWYCNVSDNTV